MRIAAIFSLPNAAARRSRARQKTTAAGMGDSPTDVHLAADILDQRGGFGGLGPLPDYSAGAKYIGQTEINGDGSPIDVFFSESSGRNPDSQRSYPRARPISHQFFGWRTSNSSIARRPVRFIPDRPPCHLQRDQRPHRPEIYGADSVDILYRHRKGRAGAISAGRDRRIDLRRAIGRASHCACDFPRAG